MFFAQLSPEMLPRARLRVLLLLLLPLFVVVVFVVARVVVSAVSAVVLVVVCVRGDACASGRMSPKQQSAPRPLTQI